LSEKKFVYKNLEKSPIALTFKLVKYDIRCDYAMPWQLNFQSPATPIMEGIVDLHHDIMGILIFIFITVTYTLIYFLYYFDIKKNKKIFSVTHNTL